MPKCEDWRRVSFKIENWGIASVKRKKSAEKQTRELGPRERFTLPAKLSEYIRSEDTPMWYKFYTIISPGKRRKFQERNVFWLEVSNFSHHSLNRSKKNQIGHTAAVVCQWIQAVNKFCWIDAEKGSQIALLVSPAVFFLSKGNENCSLTSGKSVNFWVDFLLNAKVYSKRKPDMHITSSELTAERFWAQNKMLKIWRCRYLNNDDEKAIMERSRSPSFWF